jgi:diguanylate cyclase (GGDEF)-like protein
MIDLDYFKRVNDTYGHAAGDAMLQAVASLLEDNRRVSDIVARCGGEEYFVLLPGTDEEEAATWSERVRQSMADLQVSFAGHTLGLTGSFGVASRLADTSSPEALLALADQALGVAKEAGRNRVVCFSSLADPGLQAADRPAARVPLHNVLARDVLAPAVYCPHVNDTVDRVADQFLQMRLNAAPVVDDSGRLAGIVSENDLLTAIASGGRDQQTIRTCMKTNVVQYEEHTPVKEIFRFLSRASVPRVVVVHQNRPTGVISRATLLRWLRNWTDVHPQSEPPVNTISFSSRRAGILRAADVAGDRLDALRHHLAELDADFVPCAVAEATRLEELAHDILAHCRGQERI